MEGRYIAVPKRKGIRIAFYELIKKGLTNKLSRWAVNATVAFRK